MDFFFPYKSKLIPVEVKAGSIGKLRSLHQFIENAPHTIAVPVYQGENWIKLQDKLLQKRVGLSDNHLKTQEKFYLSDISLLYSTMGFRDRMISCCKIIRTSYGERKHSPRIVAFNKIVETKMHHLGRLWEEFHSQDIYFDVVVDSEVRVLNRIGLDDLFYQEIYTKGEIIYA